MGVARGSNAVAVDAAQELIKALACRTGGQVYSLRWPTLGVCEDRFGIWQ